MLDNKSYKKNLDPSKPPFISAGIYKRVSPTCLLSWTASFCCGSTLSVVHNNVIFFKGTECVKFAKSLPLDELSLNYKPYILVKLQYIFYDCRTFPWPNIARRSQVINTNLIHQLKKSNEYQQELLHNNLRVL